MTLLICICLCIHDNFPSAALLHIRGQRPKVNVSTMGQRQTFFDPPPCRKNEKKRKKTLISCLLSRNANPAISRKKRRTFLFKLDILCDKTRVSLIRFLSVISCNFIWSARHADQKNNITHSALNYGKSTILRSLIIKF